MFSLNGILNVPNKMLKLPHQLLKLMKKFVKLNMKKLNKWLKSLLIILTKSTRLKMKKTLLCFPLLLLGCSSTHTSQLIQTPCPVLPPAPAEIMKPHESDFLKRMQNFLSPSQVKPMQLPNN